jgi:hypothetical protein
MSKKRIEYYHVPSEHWHRIHFVRPRFKSNIEAVLLYMAKECCRIKPCSCKEYNDKYYNAIRMFPGNIDSTEKTINNWRTEIPALFAFYTEDKSLDITKTSKMARFLNENQDLTQFLRLFLYSFQFPGGHLKANDLKDIILNGIKFKPAKLIIQVLMEGNKLFGEKQSEKEMSISAEEATYCIFNDIRVTSGKVSPKDIAERILSNRKNKLSYYNPKDPLVFSSKGQPRTKGDVTRYAGDILDYMEVANLLINRHGYYSLKPNELAAIKAFASDKSFFHGYDKFYEYEDFDASELNSIEPTWFQYVESSMKPGMFKTDIESLLQPGDAIDVVIDDRIKQVVTSGDRTTKDIGNLGEAIVCGHEKMRLKISGYEKLIHLVQIVDGPAYHPGYDILSFEADGTEHQRFIEVKTTVSKKEISLYGFHMSPNEWRAASTLEQHYCVYRLMISENKKVLLILRNPVGLYKSSQIEADLGDGAEISFDSDIFTPTPILTWK